MSDFSGRAFHATLFAPLPGSVEGAFAAVVELLVSLDDVLGPFDLRIGEDDPPGPSVNSADLAAFTESPAGFMAMSASATADVAKDRPPGSPLPDGVKVCLFVREPDNAIVDQLLEVVTQWCTSSRVTCAWAGSAEEERHHLFAKLLLPRGSVEAFVGRNHRVVVPGLFWWNYWSLEWLSRRGVSVESLPPAWDVRVNADGEHPYGIVSGSFPWRDWQSYVEYAEGWADETNGVFAIREMRAAIPKALNELSAVSFLRRWK